MDRGSVHVGGWEGHSWKVKSSIFHPDLHVFLAMHTIVITLTYEGHIQTELADLQGLWAGRAHRDEVELVIRADAAGMKRLGMLIMF